MTSTSSSPTEPLGAGLPRWADVALAATGLLLLAPVCAAAGCLVRLSSPGPILFRQPRVGRGGHLFTLLKFRTMRTGAPGHRVTARSDPRITPLGALLRATKIDELPQLINVLRGDMALVGPRPEVPDFVDPHHPDWQLILRARPGLTDPVALLLRREEELIEYLAGENASEAYVRCLLPLKCRAQAAYLATRTAGSDLVVILRTILAIFRRSNQTPAVVLAALEAMAKGIPTRDRR